MAVGTAKVTFEADASKVADKLQEQMRAAISKIDGMLGGVSKSAAKEGEQSGKAIGDGITAGAERAESALGKIGADGLGKVSKAAEGAGRAVAEGIGSGSTKAIQSLGLVDGRGLRTVAVSAENAGSGLASAMAKSAASANRALGTVDGRGLRLIGVSAQNAGSTIASAITSGAGTAARAVSQLNGASLGGLQNSAGNAGSTIASAIGRGATAATNHIGGIGSAFQRVTSAAANAGSSLTSSMSGSLSRVASAARSAGQQMRESLVKPLQESNKEASQLPGILSRIAGAAAFIGGPAVVLKSGFDRLMNIQRAEIMFGSVGLTAEQTRQQMTKLSDQVTGTSVSLADAAKYSAMFAQSGVELGNQMDNAIHAFTSLSAIAEGSNVDVGRVLQQISAQGKVTGGDLMQLADAGVNATKYLADSMGMSQEEVKKAVSEGKVSFDDFVKAVNEGTGDLAKQMGQTLPAKLSNFKTALANLGATIIAPFIPGITAAVDFGIALVKGAIKPIKAFIGWLQDGGVAADVFKIALAGIGTALGVGVIVGFISTMSTIPIVVTTVVNALRVLNLAFLLSGPGLIIGAIAAVVAAFVILWNKSETFRNFWIGLWEGIKNAVRPAVDSITAAWNDLMGIFSGDVNAGAALSNILGEDFANAIINGFARVREAAVQLWDSIKEVGNSLKDAALSAGGAVWDALRSVLESVWEAFQKIWDALSPLLVPILKVLAGIIGGVLLGALWVLVGVLKGLAAVFEFLGEAITWITDNVLTPLIEVLGEVVSWIVDKLGSAIAGIIDFIAGLVSGVVDFFVGLGESIGSAWESIKAGWDSVWQWLQDTWDSVGRPVVEAVKLVFLFVIGAILLAWDWLSEKFAQVWQWMGEVWESIGRPIVDWIKDAFQWLVDVVTIGWEYLKLAWSAIWAALQATWDAIGRPIVDFVVSAFNWLSQTLSAVWQWIKDRWNDLWSFVVGVYNSVIAPVIEWIKNKFGEMSNWINQKLELVKTYINAVGIVVRALYDRYVAPMVQSVTNGFNKVLNVVRGWKDGIVSALSGAGSWLLSAGRDLVQGFINGIQSMVGSLMRTVSNFASSAVNRAKQALGIRSPSREFMAIGMDVGAGMIQGLEAMAPAVAAAAADMSNVTPAVDVAGVEVTPNLGASALRPRPADLSAPAGDIEAPDVFATAAQQMKSTADGTMAPMFDRLNSAVGGFSGVLASNTLGVALPAFLGMAGGMATAQSGVINPVLQAAGNSTSVLAGVMRGEITGPIANAWTYLTQLIRWVYTGNISPVFTTMQAALRWMVSGFSWAVNAIGSQWSRLRELTAAPVRFTIGTVFNSGLVGMWNSVSELLGTNRMQPYPLRFSTGGYVRGPGGPTGDKIPALLSDREYVLNAKAVQKIGVQNLNAMNSGHVGAAPNSLRTDADLAGMVNDATFRRIASRYAGGGIVEGTPAWRALKRGYDWARSRSGRPYVWGGSANGAGGTDCSGYMSGIADVILGGNGARQWATGNFPGTQRGAWARGLAAGFSVGIRNGGPGGGHTSGTIGGVPGIPAVNVESGGSAPSRVKFGAGAAPATHRYYNQHHHLRVIDGGRFVPGAGSGVDMGDVTLQAMSPFKEKMAAAVREYGRRPGLISTVPVKAKEKLVAAAEAKIDKLMQEMTVDPGGVGSERWRPMVRRAYARQGYQWTKAKEDAWIRQIQSESGGNPNIAQQIVDINGTGESAGVGLGQMIPATFAAYRDPALPNNRRDPWAMINAMVRYGERRYGPRLLSVIGHGHGYAHGGLMGEGAGWFHKTAIKPERVLSPEQTGSFERLVDWLTGGVQLPQIQPAAADRPGDAAGSGRVTRQVIVTQNIIAADPRATADDVEKRLLALM